MEDTNKILCDTICPNCKIKTAILIDYKNTTAEKLIYLCQSCGNIFYEINPILINNNNKEKKS